MARRTHFEPVVVAYTANDIRLAFLELLEDIGRVRCQIHNSGFCRPCVGRPSRCRRHCHASCAAHFINTRGRMSCFFHGVDGVYLI
jgi:hypothetical protein